MSFLPKTRGGALWRALVACILVIGFAAATTAVAGLLQVKNIVAEIAPGAVHIPQITLPQPGKPETLLLVGSDHRPNTSFASANTDTMLLVRLDDSSRTINVMSVPRDLQVEGPDGEATKLNAIYSSDGDGTNAGGDNGLLQVLKAQVFPGLKVNHVIDVNFTGFSDLIDAIGCVYADVDHRYYNYSEPAPSPDNYSSIDIQPGYQKLCGGVNSPTGTNSALAFVRFRHTDSDKVRNARQQDFIRWAKDGYSAGQLLSNESKLITIFGKHVTTDKSLASEDGLLDLFKLVVNATALSLKTIPFPENFQNCNALPAGAPCYVFACPTLSECQGTAQIGPPVGEATEAEEDAYKQFITPTKTPAPKAATTSTTSTTSTTTATSKRHHRHTSSGPGFSTAGLIADPGDGKSQAGQLGKVSFPVYYPKYILDSYGSGYCFGITGNCNDGDEPDSAYVHSYPRKYEIRGYGHSVYKAYVMTLDINPVEGWYYTIQGTTWQDPPILRSPSKIVDVAGKRLVEYDDGGYISLIAYHTSKAVYWVSNTLDNHIPNRQMLGIAASLTQAVG
jgi:polyisoprenyl-teichoic acid--peptidoglycan teichoic acid transferase